MKAASVFLAFGLDALPVSVDAYPAKTGCKAWEAGLDTFMSKRTIASTTCTISVSGLPQEGFVAGASYDIVISSTDYALYKFHSSDGQCMGDGYVASAQSRTFAWVAPTISEDVTFHALCGSGPGQAVHVASSVVSSPASSGSTGGPSPKGNPDPATSGSSGSNTTNDIQNETSNSSTDSGSDSSTSSSNESDIDVSNSSDGGGSDNTTDDIQNEVSNSSNNSGHVSSNSSSNESDSDVSNSSDGGGSNTTDDSQNETLTSSTPSGHESSNSSKNESDRDVSNSSDGGGSNTTDDIQNETSKVNDSNTNRCKDHGQFAAVCAVGLMTIYRFVA